MKKSEAINPQTGEIKEGKLNEVIFVYTKRKNGTTRIQRDFSLCPTMAEQHTAHLTDINYLIEKYKPDELAAYIAAKHQNRQEIIGHDFSQEPSLQDAKNIVYKSRSMFEELDPDLKTQFKNHVEFLKFIDIPANAERLVRAGILKQKQIKEFQQITAVSSPPPTPTQEKETGKSETPK